MRSCAVACLRRLSNRFTKTAIVHFINYPYLSQHDPLLAKLRDEPRYQKLMERVKFKWEHFEV
jgi:hypothetical protein